MTIIIAVHLQNYIEHFEILQNEDNETCFESCPQNYLFKDTDRKYCLKECDKFFYNYDFMKIVVVVTILIIVMNAKMNPK